MSDSVSVMSDITIDSVELIDDQINNQKTPWLSKIWIYTYMFVITCLLYLYFTYYKTDLNF